MILPILQFVSFFKIKYFMGHIKRKCIFFLNIYWIVGDKSILSLPDANLFAFSDPTQLLKRIV